MKYYLAVLKKYAVFNGRASRAEYWYFVLFDIIIALVLIFIDRVTGTYRAEGGYGLLSGLYSLTLLVPRIAVAVRRLHDIGKSGWMLLIGFIPLVGLIWLIVLLATKSNPGENKYGPNPKGMLTV